MLQKLNERIQGLLAWLVIGLIAITFTLFGVDYYLQSRQNSNVEVEVNGEAITKPLFEMNYRRIRQQSDFADLSLSAERNLKQKVLEDLIVNTVSLQAAQSNGFEIGTAQVNGAILSIPQFQEDGHFSTERYQQALSGALYTPGSFQKEVRQGMLLNQQRFAFIGTAFSLPNEIKRFVRLYMQTRNYDYLTIPVVLFLQPKHIDSGRVANYYSHHQNEFLAPEKVSLSFIQLSMKKIKNSIEISDAAVQQYYQENKDSFLTPAQWQVAHILFALPANASTQMEKKAKQKALDAYQALQNNPLQFNEWITTLSDDKSNAQGVLPWFIAGESKFDKVLAELTRPGQIAPPIKTAQGYEIFKLLAYKPAAFKPLEAVRVPIKEQLRAELAQKKYEQALEQLTDLSYQSPDTLEPVAEALHLPVEHSAPFARQDSGLPFGKNKQLMRAAFSHDVLELGSNSEPIPLNNDQVIVFRIKEHFPARVRPLNEVKDYISQKLALRDAKRKAKELGAVFLAQNKKPEQERIMQQNRLQWAQVTDATRDTDKADAKINDLAFSLAHPEISAGRSLPNGYVVVRLKKINNGHLNSLDEEQRSSLAQQIEANYGIMDYDLYIKNLISQAKIKRY